MRSVLVDANVLVGYLDADDGLHERSLAGLSAATGDLVTTWPALTEAMHLLGRKGWAQQEALLALLGDGEVLVAELGTEDLPRLTALMSKYKNRPMDLADASLIRVAERDGIDTIVTLDRDFQVYRAAGIGALKIIPKP